MASSQRTLDLPLDAAPTVPDQARGAADRQAASAYLSALLNRMLRIYTSDGRMFSGTFKCTDADRNVILANTFEYRLRAGPGDSVPTLTPDVTPRFMGLVVVPGQYIVRIAEDARGYGFG